VNGSVFGKTEQRVFLGPSVAKLSLHTRSLAAVLITLALAVCFAVFNQ
jgi:hypothetical protein